MSFYIIEDGDGKLLTNDGYFDNTMVYARLYDKPSEPEHDVEEFGGHVVTLIEEPEKAVLTKEQAEIVDDAHRDEMPAGYIFSKSDEEELLMEAYVNGYTVAKEKTWLLPVPSSWCGDNNHYWHKESDGTLTWSILSGRPEDFKFSEDEINKFELQDCEKEEVNDDEQ